MISRALFSLVLLVAFATAPLSSFAAASASVPAISSVRGKVVFVKVPPGFRSVTLQQRTGVKTKPWKLIATRPTEMTGGTISILLKSAVAQRALYLSGERATPSTSTVGAGATAFLADPALSLSNGFKPTEGVRGGVVALASAASVNNVSLDSSGGGVAKTRDVTESDIWRVAGDRLYFFNELRGLQVFDVSHPDDPALLGQLREPNHGEQMYLLDPTHVALLTRPGYSFTLSVASLGAKTSAYASGSGSVVIADVTDGHPTEVGRADYPGYLVESRLVGTALYVVSHAYDGTNDGLRVTSFDLSNPAKPKQVATLPLGSYGGVVTATDRFLFVVRYSDTWRHSTIDVIDISDPKGALKQRGKIEAAGVVGDKFKMNLAGDVLTVVSAVPRDWSGDRNDPANASRTMIENFSLTKPLTPVRLGSLEIGAGETVRATRFADGRLYVVTFFTIDPLWVIDLSQPAQPTLLGELQVPGFSTYLEPLGDRLVAVGHVGSQTAVSLFDIADPAHPTLLSQLPLGDGYSYSEANWDEKAFSVLPEENLILVPYSGYDRNSGWASRVQLIDLTRDALQLRGVIDQGFAARRTAIVHDRILAVSSTDLVTVNFADRDHPAVTSDVAIAWRVDQLFLSGNYLVQIGGAAGWRSTSAPTITVSTAADPETALGDLDLENVPVVGATARAGRLYVAQQKAGYYVNGFAADGSMILGNPLILSVFDLSKLPEIKLLGRAEADGDTGYGYGTTQLEAAWPNDNTLVWVRPQWSSWWWGAPVPIAILNDALTLSNPAITVMATGTLTVTRAEAVNTNSGSLTLASNPPVSGALPAAGSLTVTAPTASASFVAESIRWIPPWYRTSSGHEMLVFDVSDSAAPKFTTKLDVRIGQTGDWSAPIALDGKLYLSSVAYNDPVEVTEGDVSRRFRHFMKRVDFANPAKPEIGPEVNLPGRLLAVVRDGATLLTLGCGYDADAQPVGKRVFHSSHFDGTTAQLVDQLETPTAYDPYALDAGTLLIGTWAIGTGQTGVLQAWKIGDNEKFALAGQINTSTFTSLAALHGLAIGFGNGLPHLFDVSAPTSLLDLPDADTRELSGGDLTHADGGAGRGIWQPLGDYGVGVVRLP